MTKKQKATLFAIVYLLPGLVVELLRLAFTIILSPITTFKDLQLFYLKKSKSK